MASGSGSSFTQGNMPHSTSYKLNELRMRTDIQDTRSLVKAYNEETDPSKRKEMLKWLDGFVKRISQQTHVTLDPDIMQAYSSLATIRCQGPKENELLKKYFFTLTDHLQRPEYCTGEIIVCLEQTLHVIDPRFIENNESLMLDLPPLLLRFLDPARKPYARKTYVEHGVALFALHQTLVVLKTVARIELPEDVILKCVDTIKKIKETATYYPYIYFARLLKYGVRMLKDQGSICAWMVVGRGLFYVMCGSLCMLQSATAAFKCEVDFAAVESGIGYFKKAWETIDRDKWSSLFQELLQAAEKSLEDDDFEHFKLTLQAIYEKRRSPFKITEEKLLRFSVIFKLGMLAIKGKSRDFRREALNELIVIVGPSKDRENWLDDGDLFEAMLDALYAVHLNNDDLGDAAAIIRRLESLAEEWEVVDKLNSWKGSCKSVEDMLLQNSMRRTLSTSDTLFAQMRKEMEFSSVSTRFRDINELKRIYTSPDFTQVTSFIDECSIMHVKDLEFHIMGYKNTPFEREGITDMFEDTNHFRQLAKSKSKTSSPIALKDMFKRNLRTGGSSSHKDKNYLLLGNAGTGKTSITKHFAHEWAMGRMGQQFEELFLLRIRNLTDSRYDNCGPMQKRSLAIAIANECFAESQSSSESYNELRERLEIALNQSSTLLILDGVDEGDETGKLLARRALERKCIVLLTSRPYNLQGIKDAVGNEMECLGLDDEQLVRYIEGQMEDAANDLIRHLRSTPSVWQVSHVPITIGVVCALWKEKQETSAAEAAIDKCRFRLYDAISNFIWERFVKKFGSSLKSLPSRNNVLEALEKIAFSARKKGEIQIRQSLVRELAPDGQVADVFRQSGFLLFQMEGSLYQFAHLSFHEFFSGRRLAQCLFGGSSRERKSAIDYISRNKYKEVHWDTFSFMMQKAVNDNGDEAIDEILSIVDQEPVDIIGAQHTFLKLRIFDAYLSMVNTIENVNYPPCCDDVVETASRLIVDLWNSIDGIELLKRHAEQLPNIMENLPQAMIDAFIKGWSRAHRRHQDLIVRIYGTLATFARICPAIVPMYKQALGDEDAKSRVAKERYFRSLENFVKPLSEPPDFVIDYLDHWLHTVSGYESEWTFDCILDILKKRPPKPQRLWRMLIDGCLNENSTIRKEAFSCINGAVKDDVHLAVQAWEHLTRNIDKNEGQTSLLEEECKHDWGDNSNTAIAIKLKCCTALRHPLPIIKEAFLTGMSDSNRLVREDVIMHLEKLAQIGNAHATIAREILVMGFEDSNSYVRSRAVTEAINVCNVLNDRDLALELLVKSCQEDSDSHVRHEAIEPLFKLISEEDSENLMNVLERCCADESSFVRRDVCYHIVDVAVRVPSLAPSVFKMLKNRWSDEDHMVRYQVVKSLCDLCLNIDPGDELSDVLSAESGDVGAEINDQIATLKEQLKVFGDETDVRFFQFLLQRHIREDSLKGSLLENKIMRMAVIIEHSDELILDVVREYLHLQKERERSRDYDWRENWYGMDSSARLLGLLVRNIQHTRETPAYASELMTLVVYLRGRESRYSTACYNIIETVPIDYILVYLLSNSHWSLDSDFTKRFMGIAVTVPDSCDNQTNGLFAYESSEETLIRKSREEMDYLVPFLKSIYPTLQSSQL